MLAADYKKILYTLLPAGPIWPSQEGESPVWDMVFGAMSLEPARVDLAAEALINEAIPDGVTYPDDLLAEWERVAGLPDENTPVNQTEAERRQALIAKLRGPGSPIESKFVSIVESYGYTSRCINGHRLVNRLGDASEWSYVGSPVVTVDADLDPWGALEADRLVAPTDSDYVTHEIFDTPNYESVYAELWVKRTGGGAEITAINLIGRDGATKDATGGVLPLNVWCHFTLTTDDIGTGASNPYLEIIPNFGGASANVTILVAGEAAGFRERYYQQASAGGCTGSFSGPDWAHVFGVEYGDNLITAGGGTGASWYSEDVMKGTVTFGSGYDPIERQPWGHRIQNGDDCYFAVDLDTDTTRDVRVSFWVQGVSLYMQPAIEGRDGLSVGSYDLKVWSEGNLTKIEMQGNLGTGAETPRVVVRTYGIMPVDFYVSHLCVSEINEDLEAKITAAAPLHTTVLFHSLGEMEPEYEAK